MNYERGVGRFASRIDEHAQPPAALRLGFSSRSKQVQQERSGVGMTSPLSEGLGQRAGDEPEVQRTCCSGARVGSHTPGEYCGR